MFLFYFPAEIKPQKAQLCSLVLAVAAATPAVMISDK